MSKKQKSAPLPTNTLDELRVTHANLMERSSAKEKAGAAAFIEDIKSFTEHLQSRGAALSDLLDRKEAQGILDYWSSHLVSNGGVDLNTWSQPRIAAYDRAHTSSATSADIEKTKAELQAIDEKNCQLIRISAQARQWRMYGKSKGYLLGGDALKNAKDFLGKDKDVDELIAESDNYASVKDRNWRMGALAVILALLALVAGLVVTIQKLLSEQIILAFSNVQLDVARKTLSRKNADLQKQISQNTDLGNKISDLGIQELRRTCGLASVDYGDEDILAKLTFDRPPPPDPNPQIKPRNPDFPRNLKLPEPSTFPQIILPNPKTFDIGTDEDRLSAALGYNKLLRGKNTTPADQLALAKSLVAMTGRNVFTALSPEGQHYLLFILSLVPAQYWDLPAWSAVRDDVRKNLVALQSQSITIDKKSQQYLEALQSYVEPANVLKKP